MNTFIILGIIILMPTLSSLPFLIAWHLKNKSTTRNRPLTRSSKMTHAYTETVKGTTLFQSFDEDHFDELDNHDIPQLTQDRLPRDS